jgi:hypothetical protein
MKILDWPEIPFWEDLAAKDTTSTFYHTPLWHDIVVKAFKRYRNLTKGFVFGDGTRAVLPLVQVKPGGLFRGASRLKSSICGGYGGVISEKLLSEEQQKQIFRYVTSLKASISIECNPFAEYTLPDYFFRKKEFVHFISLEKGEDSIYKEFSRGAKRSLNRAHERGVVVRRIERENELQSYFEVYKSTLKRWGDATRVTFPEKIFVTLFNNAGDAAKIWIAEKEGKVIGVLTLVYWNGKVHGFHAAALKEYFDCCPNNLLHMEAIRDAIKHNHRYYDFGASGGMEGVIQFKESMGAKRREYVAGHWKYRPTKRQRN